MRKQQQIWIEEHASGKTLPSETSKEASQKPSGYVVGFVEFLKAQNINPPASILDIGCGKGRNALYLAKLGYEVSVVDYVPAAIEHVKDRVEQENLVKLIHLYEHALDEPWPFKNNTFEMAIDCFSSIDIETRVGREVYKTELWRILKPGGYALVTVVSADDEIEKELIAQYPGEEKNSSIWPENGKFQKNYDEGELREFYREFKIVELKKIQKPAFKLNRHFTTSVFYLILQRPH